MTENIFNLLREVELAFVNRLQQMQPLKALSLAPYLGRLLRVIGDHPGITQNRLCQTTDRDKAQVARAIKELERRGFVTRTPHETEWRTQVIALTDSGREAADVIVHHRNATIADALKDIPEDRQQVLRETLETIRAALENPESRTAEQGGQAITHSG
ncbi:MarR family winged helix-turn-helix transcriptional regulator [Croceicoccus mobilis]|uniref:HTH marR-type domain-containing protein n=1 Tax=Croceicoccus mobilis TaxID=1703339 RepID=A0A916YXP9_9SPHN|nr:MarR family winged helix-turn-helix transcriptional regulator [Croceicoccus mobilis]GGD65922.1 hypothetical protein GCM10010990_14250 [Croceicoccus mobilis]